MPKKNYDLNDNGKIDPDEREIMLDQLRRQVLDADAKRDAQRRMAWFSLTGMLLFPFGVIFTEWAELPQASVMLASMSNIYYCQYRCYCCSVLWFHKHG